MANAEASTESPVLSIVGTLVALGPLRRDLLPLHERWANDFAVWRTVLAGVRPRPLETQAAWYERAAHATDDITFLIYERSTLRPIGAVTLAEIDHPTRTATYSIAIQEEDAWGRGFGTEATRLMLDYAFNALGLHNVMLFAYSFNERGLRAYRHAGFREFGRRRAAMRLAGRAYDVVYMDCVADEFERPVLPHM